MKRHDVSLIILSVWMLLFLIGILSYGDGLFAMGRVDFKLNQYRAFGVFFLLLFCALYVVGFSLKKGLPVTKWVIDMYFILCTICVVAALLHF